jgi:hypothetical protein
MTQFNLHSLYPKKTVSPWGDGRGDDAKDCGIILCKSLPSLALNLAAEKN